MKNITNQNTCHTKLLENALNTADISKKVV